MAYSIDLAGRVALITGASSGLGAQFARTLSAAGAAVVLASRRIEKLKDLRAQIDGEGGDAHVIELDVTDHDSIKSAVAHAETEVGSIDILVNNAGTTKDTLLLTMKKDAWDTVIHTNLDSFYNVLNPLTMPLVRRRKPGRIVTLSSVSGLAGNRGQVNYSAAKAGIIGATKALAVELASRGITVNCVAPGLIETDMVAPELLDEALKLIPVKRAGRPEEVAAVVAFLMGEDAAYITRQVISVNGGMYG